MATNGTDSATSEDRTLYIRFREGDEDRIEETLDALDRGERPSPYFEVVFDDPEDVHRVTRPQNLELLRAIVREAPESIRETARIVGRDVRPVHRNLVELEALHLIELVEEGQARRPHVWYDGIELDLPLDGPEGTSDAAPARSKRGGRCDGRAAGIDRSRKDCTPPDPNSGRPIPPGRG